MALLDPTDFKSSSSERNYRSLMLKKKSHQAKKLGPEVLVKTSRTGKPFADNDEFGMDFNIEYSLNKNNRWELPEMIADQLPKQKRATFSSLNVNLALSKKELQKIQESKNYDERYHLKGASAVSFLESNDGNTIEKTSKSQRTQLRTWNEPKKYSRPHDEKEVKVICICGKCNKPEQENIVDYTLVTYTTTCKDGDRKFWRHRIQQIENDENLYQQDSEAESRQKFVAYLPKKKKNEMRRQKHSKQAYNDE